MNTLISKISKAIPSTTSEIKFNLKKYVNENFYNYIEKKKPSNSPINLVTLGVNLKREFDVLFKNHDISNVLIENQIGPLANRMKSIQGMITQYFIMNNIILTQSIDNNPMNETFPRPK